MDLYQGLVLGLLAVSVLVLAGIFTRLGRLGRSLEASTVQPAAAGRSEDEGVPAAVAADTGAVAETTADASASEPEPVADREWELVPVAVQETQPQEGDPAAVEESEPEAEPVEAREAEPVAVEEPEDQHEAEQVAEQEAEPEHEAEPVAVEEPEDQHEAEQVDPEEPEEKPFRRDGRWWFRRDDELLVYDDASGEWVPSDDGPRESSFVIARDPAPVASVESGTDLSRETASVATKERGAGSENAGQAFAEGEATEQLAASGFWKCATCGAVNGSTAASCRMCFAARP
jgi:hypothetical protein